MATTTSRAGLKKPTSDDVDVWGELINQTFDIIDNYLGEIIDARGSFLKLKDRLDYINDTLTESAGDFATIDARFINLEDSLVGPFDSTETRKVPGELIRVRPNFIYETSTTWYSVNGSTITVNPNTDSYIIVVDGYGRFLKFENTPYSLTLTGSGKKLIIFDSSDNISGNRLRSMDLDTDAKNLGFRTIGAGLFDTRKDIALGEFDMSTSIFTPYFSSTDFIGGIFRYTNSSLSLSLPTGTNVYQYYAYPSGAIFGSIPSNISVLLHLSDGSAVRSVQLPFTGQDGRIVYSVNREKVSIDIRNFGSTGLQDSDFQIGSEFTPTSIIGYSVYLEV